MSPVDDCHSEISFSQAMTVDVSVNICRDKFDLILSGFGRIARRVMEESFRLVALIGVEANEG